MKNLSWQPKTKVSTKRFFTILIAATITVVFICSIFVYHIRKTTGSETERYISELSSSVKFSIDARLQANLEAMDSISQTYTKRKNEGFVDDYEYMQSKADVHQFVNVYIMDMDGNAKDLDGNTHDFSNVPQIMETLTGKKMVLNDKLMYGEKRNGFAYSVPIYEDGVVTGAIVACNSTEWIKNLLSQKYFDGAGFFHVLDKDGNFIVKSDSKYSMTEDKNFFDGIRQRGTFNNNSSIEQVESFVKNDEMGTFYFTMDFDHIAKIGRIIPLDTTGYYLSVIVTEQAANRQFDSLLVEAIITNVVISLLFVGLVVVLYILTNRHNKELSVLAFEDSVTEGYSKIKFENEADSFIHNTLASTYSFVSINIVNFRIINDTFGVKDGNKILKHVYNVIQNSLREDELVCRSFSDNFDILLKEDKQEDIISRINLISQNINAFNQNSSKKYYLLLTVGVYLIDDINLPIVHIRDRANVARKSNKTSIGKDLFIYSFYSEVERQRQLRNKDIENKMKDALKDGEFEVFLQPKVRLVDKRIVGAEALVRWRDKEIGLIPPDDFIPFFEQNRFIIQIDLYVFEQVCKCIRRWIEEGKKPIRVSVNISRVHLSDQGFLSKFKEILERYDVPPHYIEMELTETILSENLEAVREVVEEIHQMGLSCSIDDFGSGYSSLNLLKNINADTLKLDRAFFTTPKIDDPRERAIIESVVNMAEKLAMTTVAEGVETTEQMQFLESIHCNMVQGYVFAKPMEIKFFEELAYDSEQVSKEINNKPEEELI